MCRMTIDDTSVALVNAHLAAGQNKIRSRNADLTAIIEGKALFQESEEAVERDGVAYVGGGDGSTVLDHEIVFVSSPCSVFCGRAFTDKWHAVQWRSQLPH